MATNPNDIFTPNQIFNFGQLSGQDLSSFLPSSSQTPPITGVDIGGFGVPFNQGGGLFAGMTGLDKFNLGLQGLSSIGALISSFGALSLAKKQFRLQKDVLNTNLNNQIKAYNTALEDKARSRAVVEGQSDAERDAYIEKNKATRS